MSAFTVTTTTTVTTFPAFAPVRSICYITYHHKICAAGREVDFFFLGGGRGRGKAAVKSDLNQLNKTTNIDILKVI